MAKRTRRERMEAKLPKFTSPTTFITGFVCDDWMTRNKSLWPYSTCCQDPSNWEGRGDWQPMFGGIDPYYMAGYRYYRDVYCSCGVHISATEYRAKDA